MNPGRTCRLLILVWLGPRNLSSNARKIEPYMKGAKSKPISFSGSRDQESWILYPSWNWQATFIKTEGPYGGFEFAQGGLLFTDEILPRFQSSSDPISSTSSYPSSLPSHAGRL